MVNHFSILQNAMSELGKILRLNSQYFGLSNDNIQELEPIIQGTMQIYDMTLSQVQNININSLRQLQQSQHLGLCSNKILVNEYQNFHKELNKEKIEFFKNNIDFDFSNLNSQIIYLGFLSQVALLISIEKGLNDLNDKLILEKNDWYQQKFIGYISNFINKICDNDYKAAEITHLIDHNSLQTTMANFTLFEVQKDVSFFKDLKKINEGFDINYTLENARYDSILRNFFKI